jgi:hypothetical protein
MMGLDDRPAIMRLAVRSKNDVSLNVFDTRVADQRKDSGPYGRGPLPFGKIGNRLW